MSGELKWKWSNKVGTPGGGERVPAIECMRLSQYLKWEGARRAIVIE